jgi:hypothetical protein
VEQWNWARGDHWSGQKMKARGRGGIENVYDYEIIENKIISQN